MKPTMSSNGTLKKLIKENSVAISIWVLGLVFSVVGAGFNLYASYKLAPLVQDLAVVKQSMAQVKDVISSKADQTEISGISVELESINKRLDTIYSVLIRK